jgi:hypothetical protein
MKRWRWFVEPCVEGGCGDLFETGDPEERALLAESGVRSQFLDRLLASTRHGLGGVVEQKAHKAALADAGTNGGEEAEERVGAENVEVAIIEVCRGAELFTRDSGLDLRAVGAGEIAIVEDEQALDAGEASTESEIGGKQS